MHPTFASVSVNPSGLAQLGLRVVMSIEIIDSPLPGASGPILFSESLMDELESEKISVFSSEFPFKMRVALNP